MKKIVLGLLILLSFYSNAQETEFTFTADKGMTDFIVTPVEGKTAPEIYKKVIDWIKITYKNPDKVILSTIENEYVRFQGMGNTGLLKFYRWGGVFTPDNRFTIEISIKDGKYKFDLIDFEGYNGTYWSPVECFLLINEKCYNNKSEFKKDYKFYIEIPDYFNKLNLNIKESVLGKIEKW